jgi:hypothetical protein
MRYIYIDGKIMVINLREMILGAMDWVKMAQDRDKWCALLKRVIKFLVP